MRLTIGATSYDLSTRALVISAGGAGEGADLVELGAAPAPPAPVYASADDDAGVGRALSAGAGLVRLARPSPPALALCVAAGAAVVVPAADADVAAAAGLPADRVVPDSLLIDVTAEPWPAAATAAGVIRGARLVRTADPLGARRVCDVLAAVLGAR